MNALAAASAALPAKPPAAQLPPCLLVNSRSFRASRGGLAARATELARAGGADVIQAGDPAGVAAALDQLMAQSQRRIFVLSGDGTIQAAVDYLARLPEGIPRPQLLLLGGGRTNLTPADLGARGAVLRALASALGRWRAGEHFEVEQRATLRIEQEPAPPRHGFFVAAGLVDAVIRACHRCHASGGGALRAHLGSAFTLLRLAALGLAGRRPLPLAELRIEVPGQRPLPGPARFLIATTLRGPHGPVDPYASRGAGDVRFTALGAHARGTWRRLPLLLAGTFTDAMVADHGFLSGRCEWLRVLGLEGYTLDGEEFQTDPARPVVIRCGPRIDFLRP